MNFTYIIVVVLHFIYIKAEWSNFKWSNKDYLENAGKTSCLPQFHYNSHTLKQHGRSNNFTQLGKVIDVEVCSLLCCEVETCDLALLEEDHCYAVKCLSIDDCDLEPTDRKSEVVTMRRKKGTDIWSSGTQPNKNGAPFYKENQAKIVTKEAAVQKSSIPEIETVSHEPKGSLIAISNKDHIDSPMDALLQKESSMVKQKQNNDVNASKKSSDPQEIKQSGERIQDITEHYLKAEEKNDMTALQENETSAVHPKLIHRRQDLRHTLISPITIGAFTCMAVIAVSGFAMAIIKYQRERREYEDKQTQKP